MVINKRSWKQILNEWMTLYFVFEAWNIFLTNNNSISELLIVQYVAIIYWFTRQEYEKCTSKILGGAKFIDDHAFLLLFWLCQLCFLRSRLVAFTWFSLSLFLFLFTFFYSLVALPFVQLKANTHQRNFTWHRTQTLSFILQTY